MRVCIWLLVAMFACGGLLGTVSNVRAARL